MSINKRLSKLEQESSPKDNQPDVIHKIQMDENDNIAVVYIVGDEQMTQPEFNRRWPNYDDGGEISVTVNWDEPKAQADKLGA